MVCVVARHHPHRGSRDPPVLVAGVVLVTPPLATMEDLDAARRRADRAFFAILISIIGVIAGVGLVMIRQGQEQDLMREQLAINGCLFAQDNARAGIRAAQYQADRDRAAARWLHSQGHHDLAHRFEQAARFEGRLAASRRRFARADCRALTEPIATGIDTTTEGPTP